ncbi:MAG: hypothetical protein Tsb0021_14650 [Chlamydiales bacterium]
MSNTAFETEPILVVDDDEMVCEVLAKTLSRQSYSVKKALSGNDAINILKQAPIALLICDQNLPDMKGVEVLREAMRLQPEAERIAITGLSDLNTITDLINVGQISHFILKPWDNTALLNTVDKALQQYRLKKENVRLHAEIAQRHEMLKREIELGGTIQNNILYGKIPKKVPHLQIAACSCPSKYIDGDFYEFYQPSGELLDVVLADVMGKGLPAALVGTSVKTEMNRFAKPVNETLVFKKKSGWQLDVFSPDSIMKHVQQEVVHSLREIEYFVSLSYARFNLNTYTISLVDCGSTKPIHYRASDGSVQLLKGENLPLGFIDHDDYKIKEFSFSYGDLFVFYSDGITEAMNDQGEQFGVERMENLVKKHRYLTPNAFIKKIKEEMYSFTGRTNYDDDMTMIVIRVLEKSETSLPVVAIKGKFSADLSQLQAVRDFIDSHCKEIPGDQKRMSEQLQLIGTEAFTNIVEHAYQGNMGEILLEFDKAEGGILMNFKDQGKVFDPRSVQEPSLAGDRFRGFGLFLIKQLADRIAYSSKSTDHQWNEWTIYKKYILEEEVMDFTHEIDQGILVVVLQGTTLDAKEAPEFKKSILNLIEENQVQNIILDLHKLNFIDSSGLGCFLSILRQLNSKGGEVKIAQMSKSIRTVFELVCMHKIFEVYNSVEEAKRSFSKKVQV